METVGVKEYSVVGKPLPRIDGFDKATGAAKFTDDLVLSQMLYGKILRSPYPHAKIINIDTSKAGKLPGVKAVITGEDIPKVRYGWRDTLPPDKYPLAIDKVRFIGDEVAAVVAIDEETAEEALNLIRVDYELLPSVFDPIEAIKEGAPVIHEDLIPSSELAWEELGLGPKPQPYKVVNNVGAAFSRSHGDIEQGFNEADYISEDRFSIPATAHCAMEPHVALASFDFSGNLQIWLCHQGYEVKRQWLAALLGIPMGKIRILKSYVGGAFGGKIMLFSFEFLAAFLSKKTGKPVKITLSREETFAANYLDQRMAIDIKTGIKRNGTLTAQQTKIVIDAGAYRGSSMIALWLAYSKTVPVYNIPNVKHEGICVYTNKSTCGPKRGHGTPQMVYAIESHLDMIAENLGLDPVELRLKNVRKQGTILPFGMKLESCGLTECIEKAAESSGWEVKRGKIKDRGIGIGLSAAQNGANVYPLGSAAMVKLDPEGSITLFTGTVDTGQAADTVMCQIVAEELGVSLGDVNIVSADSELCSIDLGNYAMGGIHITGEAVMLAAADAKRQLLEQASKALGRKVDELEVMDHALYIKGTSTKLASFSEVLKKDQKEGGVIIGKGFCKAALPTKFGFVTNAYSFTVAVAEVEVNRETGKIRLLKVTVAHDAGFPINPLSVEGQIEGQVIMGQGDMFFEEILTKEGKVINPSFIDYSLQGALDTAELKFIDVYTFEPRGPFGAKQAGECARPPVLAAVSNAIYHATGIRFKELPITAEKILAALKK